MCHLPYGHVGCLKARVFPPPSGEPWPFNLFVSRTSTPSPRVRTYLNPRSSRPRTRVSRPSLCELTSPRCGWGRDDLRWGGRGQIQARHAEARGNVVAEFGRKVRPYAGGCVAACAVSNIPQPRGIGSCCATVLRTARGPARIGGLNQTQAPDIVAPCVLPSIRVYPQRVVRQPWSLHALRCAGERGRAGTHEEPMRCRHGLLLLAACVAERGSHF